MKKMFNVTGICLPEYHYMMDSSQKEKEVMKMVEAGQYFIINRPRQYGKTTMLKILQEVMEASGEFVGIKLSFEDVEEKFHQSEEAFAEMFASRMGLELRLTSEELGAVWLNFQHDIDSFSTLSRAISDLVDQVEKKLVLLIDEVDASSNYQVFLKFLAMLRNKYLQRYRKGHRTFHSIILAGVHDIKSLKYKLRDPLEAQFNSPWNIAADFKVRMSFTPEEIEPMLNQYCEAESAEMDISQIAQQLYYFTSGYPFLISKLCKIIAEDILPQKSIHQWDISDVEKAVQLLLKENNTNFDSLVKNLENNEELYALVYRLIIDGDVIPFNQHNPTISLGVMYGIFRSNGQLKIHNRIYEQLIYNYMASKALTNLKSEHIYGGHFLLENNALDLEAVLLKFQQFMKEQHSKKHQDFLEDQGRLVFLSFLAPILNGHGYSFREVQTSEEKRLDIVVTYYQHTYIIELKRWYGPKAHEGGLNQLADYLDIHGVDNGYLLIFDSRKERAWHQERITHQGKEIFAVWV